MIAKSRAADNDLVVPKAQHARYQEAFERFAQVFPDDFYVSERGRYFPADTQDQGRLLSAGYHNVMGYYRDDTALRELILDDKGQKEIDRLWNEFDFIAQQTERTWVQWFFNQSGEVAGKGDEGGSPRPVDHEVTDQAVVYEPPRPLRLKGRRQSPRTIQSPQAPFASISSASTRSSAISKKNTPKPSRNISTRS